jgi:hypothetical protein
VWNSCCDFTKNARAQEDEECQSAARGVFPRDVSVFFGARAEQIIRSAGRMFNFLLNFLSQCAGRVNHLACSSPPCTNIHPPRPATIAHAASFSGSKTPCRRHRRLSLLTKSTAQSILPTINASLELYFHNFEYAVGFAGRADVITDIALFSYLYLLAFGRAPLR